MQKSQSHYMVKIGMLGAIAIILQYIGSLIGLRIGFLDIEISDYPAIIASLALGPGAGILTELIKNIIHLTISTTGFVGELANFLINGIFVACIGFIYKTHKTKKGAILSLSFGIMALCVAGIFVNCFLMLPLYMPGSDFPTRFVMSVSLILPFNFVRGLLLAALTMFTYKPLSPIMHR